MGAAELGGAAAVVVDVATRKGQPEDIDAGERKRVGSALGAW